MQGWWKLLIPLGLGVAAALLNYMGRSSDIEPVYYVALKKDLKTGDELKPEHLEFASLPKNNSASLAKVGIPYGQRAVVFGRRVQRSMKKGDVVLWSDVTSQAKQWNENEVLLHMSVPNIPIPDLRVGQKIAFVLPRERIDPVATGKDDKVKTPSPKDTENYRVVGPFRVHSLGRSVNAEDAGTGGTATFQEITLFVPAPGKDNEFDTTTRQLLTTLFRPGSSMNRGSIILYAPETAAAPSETPKTKE